MREHGFPDDIANGIDAGNIRLHPFIHENFTACADLHPGLLQANPTRIEPSSNRHQHLLHVQGESVAKMCRHHVGLPNDLVDRDAGANVHFALIPAPSSG